MRTNKSICLYIVFEDDGEDYVRELWYYLNNVVCVIKLYEQYYTKLRKLRLFMYVRERLRECGGHLIQVKHARALNSRGLCKIY